MEDFKHINFDVSKQKVNNWKRRINSNTLHMGIRKNVSPPRPPSQPQPSIDCAPSEISSLCSNDDIFKIIARQKKQPKAKPVLPARKPKPPSPLVFLDIDKFKKNKSIVHNTIDNRQQINAKINNIQKQTPLMTEPETIKMRPVCPQYKKECVPELIKPVRNTIHKKRRYKIKSMTAQDNKKCLDNANLFSLNQIKSKLKKNNIHISKGTPEKLCRDLYLMYNIVV